MMVGAESEAPRPALILEAPETQLDTSNVEEMVLEAAGGVKLDYRKVPAYEEIQSIATVAPTSEPPVAMTAFVCGCLAASKSKIAAALEREAASLRQENAKKHHKKGGSRLTPQLLEEQALEERNDAAERALEAYYQLAEIQLQQVVLTKNMQELEDTKATVQGLRNADIEVALDPTELDRQSAQLALQQAKLQFAQAQAAARVKSLIGADPMSGWPIETTCSIEPRFPEYELNEAIAIARQHDSQLIALQKLRDSHDPKDLEQARKLMGVISPLAGQEPSYGCLLAYLGAKCGCGAAHRRESNLRRGQMTKLYDARQQQLDLEVAAAMIRIREALVAVGIAKDVRDSWVKRVSVLESQREVQKASYLDVINAKSELLLAESALYHELALLEIAHVKLRGAMGLLGRECASMAAEIQGYDDSYCQPEH